MIKKETTHQWTIQLPSEKMSVLTNDEDDVAVIYKDSNFGDAQALLLRVTDASVKIISMPHYIEDIEFTLNKEIILTLSPFANELDSEQFKES